MFQTDEGTLSSKKLLVNCVSWTYLDTMPAMQFRGEPDNIREDKMRIDRQVSEMNKHTAYSQPSI